MLRPRRPKPCEITVTNDRGLELTFFFIADRNKHMEPALTPHEGVTKGGDKEV